MSKYKRKILLAVDGSDQALDAVRYVSQLFPPNRMTVVLFHVMNEIPESYWDIKKNPAFRHKLAHVAAWATQQKTEIQEFMEKSRQLFVDRGIPEKAVTIKLQDRQQGIARDIAREARGDYDALVVGRWGVSKVKDLIWGSVASKLVGHLLHVPLWVVGGTPYTGTILVALDASEEAIRVVDYVGSMVEGSNWKVTLFHVIRGFEDLTTETRAEFRQAEQAVVDLFEQSIARLEKAGLKSDLITMKTVTKMPSRAKAIVEEAKKDGYGTIVLGRRGLSRVEEFFMGRVSNKVMQLAKEMAVWVVN
jgi:nucleotide-binding universal stress UspA family protein